eukprot:m.48145 g.48145  ORF g.48145 m.48145 type:complete len:552 (-) comp10554_c0_seq6:1590-3245(-)
MDEQGFKEEIYSNLVKRDRELQGLSDIIFVHNRLQEKCRNAERETKALQNDYESIKKERIEILRKVELAEGERDAKVSAASQAEVEKKDKKIAELTLELYDLHKKQNEESQRELDLHRQVKDLENELSKKKAQLEKVSAHNSFLDQENEKLKSDVEEKSAAFRNLTDELQALQLEYNTTQERLRDKTVELDELVKRWMKLKKDEADRMNKECITFEKQRQNQVQRELLEAAKGLDKHDKELERMGLDGVVRSQIPNRMAHSFEAHNSVISSLRYSKQGYSASGSDDKTVKIWDTSGNCKARLVGHSGAISCLRFNPSGEHLISGGADHRVFIYSLETFRSIYTLNNHSNIVLDVTYSNDANSLFTTGKDHKICMFDAKSATFKRSALMDSTCHALCSFMTTELVTAHFNKTLQVRDPRTSFTKSISEIETGHTDMITGIAMHPSGVRVITYSKDHTLKEFDMRTLQSSTTFSHPDFRVGNLGCHASYSTDGQHVVSGSKDGHLYIWHSDGSLEKVIKQGGHNGAITNCCWKPSGDEVLTSGKDKMLKIWLP